MWWLEEKVKAQILTQKQHAKTVPWGGCKALESQTPPSGICLLQHGHTFQAYSHSTTNWGPSTQTSESRRDILTQATLHP